MTDLDGRMPRRWSDLKTPTGYIKRAERLGHCRIVVRVEYTDKPYNAGKVLCKRIFE